MKQWLPLASAMVVLAGTPVMAQPASGVSPPVATAEAPVQAAAPPGTADGTTPFKDVPAEHWAAVAIGVLYQLGILTGYPDGTFGGNRALTRYEFAVGLQRFLGHVQKQIEERLKETPSSASTPAPQPPTPPAGSERLRSSVEQTRAIAELRRDVDELKRIFAGMQVRAAELRRELDAIRRQIGVVETAAR